MKLALIYNRNQRIALGECLRKVLDAYSKIEIDQFDLIEIKKIHGGYDLYLRIDDGDYTVDIPKNLYPSAWWVADTHLQKPYKKIRSKIKNYDFIFCAQKEGAERLKKETKKYTYWIPWGVDDVCLNFDFLREEEKMWDICFIGTAGKYSLRKVVLEIIKINYPNSFVGRARYSEIFDYYRKGKIVKTIL